MNKMNKYLSGALAFAAPLVMLTMTGCSQGGERTVETSNTTVHDPITDTKVTEKTYSTIDGDKHVETNVQTVETDRGLLNGERDVVRIDSDKLEEDTSREVRAPLVRVKSNDETGSVHIKVPFVRIDKDGHGEKTRVKLPGIRINTDD